MEGVHQPSQAQELGSPILQSEKQPRKTALRLGTKTVRILIADDHDIIRRGLKQLLTSRAGWEVCGEAKTGREAVTLAEQLKPEIGVWNISIPALNGLGAPRKIQNFFPKRGFFFLPLLFSAQPLR